MKKTSKVHGKLEHANQFMNGHLISIDSIWLTSMPWMEETFYKHEACTLNQILAFFCDLKVYFKKFNIFLF
jgi:hypothetical protein